MNWRRHVVRMSVFLVGDAIACAIPLSYIERDLDHIRCPEPLRQAIPPIKAAAAAGLLLGLRWPRLGRLTAGALVGYFLCAIGFHVRVKDPAWRSAPAASLLATSLALRQRAYTSRAA